MKSVWSGKLEYNSSDWKHVPENAKERKAQKVICFLNGLHGSLSSVDIYDKLTYDYFNYYSLDLDRLHMIFSSLPHLIRF